MRKISRIEFEFEQYSDNRIWWKGKTTKLIRSIHTVQIVDHQHDICITVIICFKTDQNYMFIFSPESLWPLPAARDEYDCVFQVKMKNTVGSAAIVHLFVQESLDDTPAFPVNNCLQHPLNPSEFRNTIDQFCVLLF